MTIKSQTLRDYHNHVIRLINKHIEFLNCKPTQFINNGEIRKYFEIQNAIVELEELKSIVIKDFENSNYGKCGKGDVE